MEVLVPHRKYKHYHHETRYICTSDRCCSKQLKLNNRLLAVHQHAQMMSQVHLDVPQITS